MAALLGGRTVAASPTSSVPFAPVAEVVEGVADPVAGAVTGAVAEPPAADGRGAAAGPPVGTTRGILAMMCSPLTRSPRAS